MDKDYHDRVGDHGGALGYVGASYPELLREGLEVHGSLIDSKLGSNPTGAPKELIDAFANSLTSGKKEVGIITLIGEILTNGEKYSDDVFGIKSKESLRSYYGFNADSQSIEFHGNGSYGAGDEVVRIIKSSGIASKILVTPQSFPNVGQYCERHGIKYEVINTNSIAPLDSLRSMVSNNTVDIRDSVLYLDTPNNPYGQVDVQLTHDVIDYAHTHGVRSFVDLAYGDVLGVQNMGELVNHTLECGGFAVGSLSKTFGLAGHRAGWLVVAEEIANSYYKGSQKLVFGINNLSSHLLRLLMEQDDSGNSIALLHTQRVIEHNVRTNIKMYDQLHKMGITVYDTDPRVPIQVVSDGREAFFERVMSEGIETESLSDYDGTLSASQRGSSLGNTAIRLLTPPSDEVMEGVIYRLGRAMNK